MKKGRTEIIWTCLLNHIDCGRCERWKNDRNCRPINKASINF